MPSACEFDSHRPHHIETIGLIRKISVLFIILGVISLDSGIFCSISGEVATFYLSFQVRDNLSEARKARFER